MVAWADYWLLFHILFDIILTLSYLRCVTVHRMVLYVLSSRFVMRGDLLLRKISSNII